MTLTLMSFGYSKGKPKTFDAMFDARGITNPARKGGNVPDGRDPATQQVVVADPKARAIIRAVVELAKAHPNAVVAVGCRYGKHRSVALVERIAKNIGAFSDIHGEKITTDVYHLDLDEDYVGQQRYEQKVL